MADQDKTIPNSNGGENPNEKQPEQDETAAAPKLLDQAELESLLAQFNAEKAQQNQEPNPVLDQEILPQSSNEMLDQRELDALIASTAAASEKSIDSAVIPESTEDKTASFLSQEELDQLITAMDDDKPLGEMTKMDTVVEPPPAVPPAPTQPPDTVTRAASPREAQDISAENVASAAPEEDALLSQDLLDALLSEAKTAEAAPAPPAAEPAAQPAPPPAAPPEPKPEAPKKTSPEPEKPLIPPHRFRKKLPIREMLKVGVSIAFGILCAAAAYSLLSGFQEKKPSLEDLKSAATDDLLNAIENAKHVIATKEYTKAAYYLDKAIPKASPAHPLLPDAAFLRLSARVLAVPPAPSTQSLERIQEEIDQTVKKYPDHKKVPEALRWKAQLYEKASMPEMAFETYKQLLETYAEVPDEDALLHDATKLALTLRRDSDAAAFAQRLVDKFPTSKFAPSARLVLGDIVARAGNSDMAKRIYEEVAQTQTHSSVGSEAVARLAQLELDAGRYADAATRLENHIKTTTSAAGSDLIHMLLARAYDGMGRLNQAEQVLRDLIAFFPDSEQTPKAYVALAQVLDKQGKRRDATRLLNQAALRYPADPDVMRAMGKLLAANGDLLGAAEALASADAAGARDPALLLESAKYYRAAGDTEHALALYDRLLMNYPTVPEAFQARIEIAKTLLEQGKLHKAFQTIRDLATLSANKPQYLPVLAAQAELYESMGLRTDAVRSYAELVSLSQDPREQAKAIIGILRNGGLDEGLAAATKIDPKTLPDAEAYAFLQAYGKALLKNDPTHGLALLEQAYTQYPSQRTPEDGLTLLQAYLATDRTDSARAVLAELGQDAKTNPVHLPVFQQASLAWADYLYEKGDYAQAADVYAQVPSLSDTNDDLAAWANFQQGSALLRLKDYDRAIELFDQVAATKSSWASLAKQKAAYARLEKTLIREMPALFPSIQETSL
ncbi:MAG TPA: tetratricopeptide repeat protein [Candidatus Hydrogenedentes bacterium]|nr:tetratricopeptide repeat protein [Candidatus Hydrogenedentota bacterium]HOL78245.1 tetratricopeptide repeat protein [Candidatus Hydrogenedentota bacterium]HPO86385.1 tetratricopeptide repeat protein [Candidatus Hydrogenedentota bacterium]